MSLPELTRNAFQSGIPPAQWLGLCRLQAAKTQPDIPAEQLSGVVCNSVISLCRSYPAHATLRDYLKSAIDDSVVPLAVYIVIFLQAARSPELQDSGTLQMLCQLALDEHYSSGSTPVGSVVAHSESAIAILGSVQDALALLRLAHSIHALHTFRLTSAVSELVILLLSCVTDISQVSTAQAMVHFADANDMLHTFPLTPDVRQVLGTFVMSLGLLIGDDAKVAREAQMMHNLQMALGKHHLASPSPDADVMTCGLMLSRMLYARAGRFGAGKTQEAVACMVGVLRWTSWTPITFYTQLLSSALGCIANESNGGAFFLWRAFILGRLPKLLIAFEKSSDNENIAKADWRTALQVALTTILQRSELIAQCDHIASQYGGFQHGHDSVHDEHDGPHSFTRELIQQLLMHGLVDHSFATNLDHSVSSENSSPLQLEVQEAGTDLQSYLDTKLIADPSSDDAGIWLERVYQDPGSHADFAEIIHKRFSLLNQSTEVEVPSYICKLLYTYHSALDIVSMHVDLTEITLKALHFLLEYDCETVGDPQTAVSHLGDIVLFVQSTTIRFQLLGASSSAGEEDIIRCPSIVHAVDDLAGESATAFNLWFKALFDKSSEGIEDTILRSTKPRTLLKIASTLISHAISARSNKTINIDVLNNGVSYFTGSLLNWTLFGVVKGLLRDIQQKGSSAVVQLEVLQTLLMAPSCPTPVKGLCGANIIRVFTNRKRQGIVEPSQFDSALIQSLACQAIGINATGTDSPQRTRIDQSRTIIREALLLGRAGKVNFVDVDRCLLITPPNVLIQFLWAELCVASSLGQMEDCKRLATFILVVGPRSVHSPRLLPIFIHGVLPLLVAGIDQQQPPERAMNTNLMVVVLSQVLTAALHLEWAVHTVCGQGALPGQSTMTMARRLAGDLRSKRSNNTSRLIAQQLSASAPFVAKFPVFKAAEI